MGRFAAREGWQLQGQHQHWIRSSGTDEFWVGCSGSQREAGPDSSEGTRVGGIWMREGGLQGRRGHRIEWWQDVPGRMATHTSMHGRNRPEKKGRWSGEGCTV